MSKSQSRNISPTEHKRIKRKFFNDKKVRIGCQFVLINLLGKKVRCGYNEDPSLLDWHHPSPGQKYKHDNGKRLSVAEMISRGLNKDLIEAETNKCIVLCRKHHAEVEMKKGGK
jgi:hypothetical protein